MLHLIFTVSVLVYITTMLYLKKNQNVGSIVFRAYKAVFMAYRGVLPLVVTE